MKTATHKFEFYSETLKVALETHASKHGKSVNEVMNACHYTAEGELAYVPTTSRHSDSAMSRPIPCCLSITSRA